MENVIIRKAAVSDIPFLVETIVEAEKSGTDKLSYATIFGLTEAEVKVYLSGMMAEEIDGCELSVSSFLVAESGGKTAAALSAWIEGSEGIPSAILKGNLLNYSLPERCIKRAMELNSMIREIHIEYYPETIQIGAGYVDAEFRGHKLLGLLTDEITGRLIKTNPAVSTIWAQIFSCNTPSIRTYEKAGFVEVGRKESFNEAILQYLPSNIKILMKKDIVTT
ncbi:MAG: GNAT family N-acetyltransferase [Bacteroidota bacterium]